MQNEVMDIRAEQWRKIILEARSSELTIKEWLIRNNVSRDAYFYWQRKLRMQDIASLNTAPSSTSIPINTNKAFVEITSAEQASSPQSSPSVIQPAIVPELMIKYGDYQIYAGNNISERSLSIVIKVLSNA